MLNKIIHKLINYYNQKNINYNHYNNKNKLLLGLRN
jgi:hypothetical protein